MGDHDVEGLASGGPGFRYMVEHVEPMVTVGYVDHLNRDIGARSSGQEPLGLLGDRGSFEAPSGHCESVENIVKCREPNGRVNGLGCLPRRA
jgi:hypothetical protein